MQIIVGADIRISMNKFFQIKALLENGQIIASIRELRMDNPQLSLLESNKIIEDMAEELGLIKHIPCPACDGAGVIRNFKWWKQKGVLK
jgi:hypothetical protein